jgi:uncharacterized protein (UPF0276 family)
MIPAQNSLKGVDSSPPRSIPETNPESKQLNSQEGSQPVTQQLFRGGVGLRPVHYDEYASSPPSNITWLEIISENYMDTEGRPLSILENLRKNYPMAAHGVSLNIGSPDPVNFDYLKRLKTLINRLDPFIVSDHLCWTGFSAHNAHDLLPLVHNESALATISQKVSQVQDFLGRPIALENVSSYIESKHSTMSEAEFLNALTQQSGCQILLDINNIYVSESNFARDPKKFIDAIRPESVAQIHLAGFSDMGKFYFDTHSNPVFAEVWELYRYALPQFHAKPTLIEWDENIPDLKTLGQELAKAEKIHADYFDSQQDCETRP